MPGSPVSKVAKRHAPELARRCRRIGGGLILIALLLVRANIVTAQPTDANRDQAGNPPASPRTKGGSTTFHIKAVIDGADGVRVTADAVEWVHRSGNWPADVTLNGRPWDPRRQPQITGNDLLAYLPKGVVFGPFEILTKKGRGDIAMRIGARGAVNLEFRDPAVGSAEYEAEFRMRDLTWLSSGAFRFPAPAAGDLYPGDIRITARVDVTDELRLHRDRAEWQHTSGRFTGTIKINGVAWTPDARNKVLRNEGATTFFPEAGELFAATMWKLRGRGKVELRMLPDGLLVQFNDPDPGDDEYEVVIHQREMFDDTGVPVEDEGRVAKLFAATPRTPHPKGRDIPTVRDFEKLRRAWRRSRLTLAYENFGRRDQAWDEAARRFLDMEVPLEPEQQPAEEIVAAGYELIDRGCDDPLVCYVLGRQLSRLGRLAEGEPFVLHAVLEFEKMKYPRRASRLAPALLARMYLNQTAPRAQQAYGLAERAYKETVETAREQLSNDERRGLLAELRDTFADPALVGHESALVRMLVDAGDGDPWIVHMVVNDYYARLAFRERSTNFRVLDEELRTWGSYAGQISQIRNHAIMAWAAHPELPEAPQRVIAPSLLDNTPGRATPRFWFDQAVAAQIDANGAHEDMLSTLRPRAGGSHEQMLDFGLECLRTGRFDTEVPNTFFRALRAIQDEGGDLRGLISRGNLADEVRQAFAESEREKSGLELQRVLTRNLILAFILGWRDDARRRLDALQENFDDPTGKQWSLSRSYIGYDLASPQQSFVQAPEIKTAGPLFEKSGQIRILAVAPDGRQIAVDSEQPDGRWLITVWNLADHTSQQVVPDGLRMFQSIKFSPDSTTLAALQKNMGALGPRALSQTSGWVTLWNRSDARSRDLTPSGYKFAAAFDWLPGSRHLAVNTMTSVLMIDVATNKQLAASPEFKEKATALAVSPVDRQLAVGFADGLIQLFEIPAAEALQPGGAPGAIRHIADLKQHIGLVDRLEYSPDGKSLASSSLADNSVWVWATATRAARHRFPGLHVTFSPDGKQVATAAGRDLLRNAVIWDVSTGMARARCTIPDESGMLMSLAFTADGEFLLAPTFDGFIYIWPAR